MPCNGGNYFGGDPEDQRTIDGLTRKLCHALELLALTRVQEVDMPAELDEWWYEHRLKDQARTEEAKRRAAAQDARVRRSTYLKSVKERMLIQLTDDEREALGLPRRAK